MLEQLWDTFVVMIPVFFLLTMIFGAGFYIGRVRESGSYIRRDFNFSKRSFASSGVSESEVTRISSITF